MDIGPKGVLGNREGLHDRDAESLAGKSKEIDGPYPGPRPFSIKESEFFCGREGEKADLRDLLLTYRAVLLYSQSGAGKSSLVSAGLLAPLDRSQWVSGRVAGEYPDKSLGPVNIHTYNLLHSSNIGLTGPTPPTLAARLARVNSNTPWFLVLDQFEEMFTACPERWKDRQQFFEEIAKLFVTDRQIHVLFVIREEYVAELDRFSSYLPDGFRIRYRLERLRKLEALEAIVKPAEQTEESNKSRRMQELAEPIVENLLQVPVENKDGSVIKVEGEYVEPVHLQVVCRDLWSRLENATEANHSTALVDVDTALGNYYNNVLRKISRSNPWREYQLRRWFATSLVTRSGTRGIVFMNLRKGETEGIPNAQVEQLESEHLLRLAPRAGARWYELTHDRFISPIRLSNRAYKHRWRFRLLAPAVLFFAVTLAVIMHWYIMTLTKAHQDLTASNEKLTKSEAKYESTKDSLNAITDTVAALTSGQPPETAARTYATLALAQWKLGEKDRATLYLNEARKKNAEAAMKAIDGYIETAEQSQDPGTTSLYEARQEYMKGLTPFLKQSAELRHYLCLNGFVVVTASETVDAAPALLERIRTVFPNAELGEIHGAYRRIYADMFIKCDHANEILAKAKQKVRNDAYVENWFSPTCPRCSTNVLPISEPNNRPFQQTQAYKSLALIAAFSTNKETPASFGAISGDFDGQGISFGVLQWNIGQGSLQPLFAEMNQNHPDILRQVFGPNYSAFVAMLGETLDEQLAWARSIQDVQHRVFEPWRTVLESLAAIPEFQQIEVEHADRIYQQAISLCDDFGLWSERGLALMYDIKVQTGGIKSSVKVPIKQDFDTLGTPGTPEEVEVARMRIIAHRAASANPTWIADIRKRELIIAEGFGTYHGKSYDLASQFNIRLVPIDRK